MATHIISNGEPEVLSAESKNKLEPLMELAYIHSCKNLLNSIGHFNLRRRFAKPKFKNYETFANYELFKAAEDLPKRDLSGYWTLFSKALEKFKEEGKGIEFENCYFLDKSNKKSKKILINDKSFWIHWHFTTPFYKDHFRLLFYELIIALDLAEDFLQMNIDIEIPFVDSDTTGYKKFNEVIELVSQFQWIEFLMLIIEYKAYDKEIIIQPGRKVPDLTFEMLFRKEYRSTIPKEVIRLLGPGEADAWDYKDGKKDWIYAGPESAIMVPFYSLVEMGYIEIPSRGKNKFIKVWLSEFGKDYKSKTFDKIPKDYKSNEYFTEYLNKLEK